MPHTKPFRNYLNRSTAKYKSVYSGVFADIAHNRLSGL